MRFPHRLAPRATALALLTLVAVLSTACGSGNDIDAALAETEGTTADAADADADIAEPDLQSPNDASEPPSAPDVATSSAVDRALVRAGTETNTVSTLVVTAAGREPDEDSLRELIVGLRRLEDALDADAIRALGDDPVLEAIAAPVDELDRSVLRVLALVSDPTGPADYVAALAEAAAAIRDWEAAVPEIEAAWADAVERWTATWDDAALEWEQAWADAATEWEAAWQAAIEEWTSGRPGE